MRKLSLILIGAALCFCNVSCLKSSTPSTCTTNSVAQDEPTILAYLNANSITGYVKDPSGLYYKIENPGTGISPNVSSTVYVKYTGTFTDKTSFDSLSDASKSGWVLGTLIKGWQIGLPLIQKGGKMMLFIPSALGYGCQQTGPIPGNTVLVFEIELVDVK